MRIQACGTTLLVFFAAVAGFAQTSDTRFDGKSWWAHAKYFASDDLEGREPGSPGLQRAEAYVVDRLKRKGINPAGTNGYCQPIKLISRQLDETRSSVSLVRDGKQEPLVLGDDATLGTRVDAASSVDAPLVFVGYGLRVPEMKIDDFLGVETKGKVLVVFSGSPSVLSAALAAHYQSTGQRGEGVGGNRCNRLCHHS